MAYAKTFARNKEIHAGSKTLPASIKENEAHKVISLVAETKGFLGECVSFSLSYHLLSDHPYIM